MRAVVWLALLGISPTLLHGEDVLMLTTSGVQCDLGAPGKFTLGIPALDGRGTHAPALKESLITDGKTLTAKYGAPFEGVGLVMQVTDGNKVRYAYTDLPADLHIVMCQLNLPTSSIQPGLTVTFDQAPPITIPAVPGKTNKDVNLASMNAQKFAIAWPTGESLALTTPTRCWHGIQDARVWSKNYISVCITPSLTRDTAGEDKSTFTLTFAVTKPVPPSNNP